VQRVPENGTVIDIERPSRKKADPVLPRSAANGFDSGAALNLRVVGSIPTGSPAFAHACFQTRASAWQATRAPSVIGRPSLLIVVRPIENRVQLGTRATKND